MLFCTFPLRSRVPHSEHHRAAVLGKRYTSKDALSANIINEVCPIEQLRERAIEAGNRLAGKDGLKRTVLAAIKHDLYRDTYVSLMQPVQFHSNL